MTRESHEPLLPPDDSSTRDRILNAAMQLFADRGFGATPIKAIARACNLSDAGVFHYFPTKREILEALLERPHQRLEQRASDEPVRDFESLDALVLRTLDSAHVNEPILRVLIRQQLVGDPEAMAARDAALKNWRDLLRRWFNEYDAEDAEILVEAFINGFMGWIFLMQVRHGAGLGSRLVNEHFRNETCAHIRLCVPLERFTLGARKRHSSESDAKA